MPTLTVTKTYQDTQVLNESDLDNIKNSIETFINTTKLDSDNLQEAGIVAGKLATDAVVFSNLADDITDRFVPMGTIIPWYSFSATLTFSATYWASCNGSTATVAGLGAVTLPDLSNRYLVGFGTEAGEDIASATWGVSAVGAASHQLDLSHTHIGPNHNHGPGTLQFQTIETETNVAYAYTSQGNRVSFANELNAGTFGGDPVTNITSGGPNYRYTKGGTGTTDNDGNQATSAVPTASQSIQPRSIRVRYLMRIA